MGQMSQMLMLMLMLWPHKAMGCARIVWRWALTTSILISRLLLNLLSPASRQSCERDIQRFRDNLRQKWFTTLVG